MDEEYWALLHTAEHVFARSLQEVGVGIHVRKADTSRDDGKGEVFIKEVIEIDKILEAEALTNRKAAEGLKVEEETFPTLKEAAAKFPKLRFNEDRVPEKEKAGGGIRVVKIGDFDFSACGQRHIGDTVDIRLFLVDGVSYLGGETKIVFEAGEKALDSARDTSDTLVRLGLKHNFAPRFVAEKFEAARESLDEADREGRRLFELLLRGSERVLDVGKLRIADFYKTMDDFTRKNPSSFVAVSSDSQIFVIKGTKSDFDMAGLGKRLEKAGFRGKISGEVINGRNGQSVREILEEFVNGRS